MEMLTFIVHNQQPSAYGADTQKRPGQMCYFSCLQSGIPVLQHCKKAVIRTSATSRHCRDMTTAVQSEFKA